MNRVWPRSSETAEGSSSNRLAGDRTARRDRLPVRTEVRRKLLHLATLALPLLIWHMPRPYSIALLSIGAGAALLTEVVRRYVPWARYHFLTRTRPLLRGHERKGWAGATYMAIAYLLVYLVFPLPIAVLAMVYSAGGDAAAAIIGKRWGRHRMRTGKSWEGFTAGLAVNFAVGLFVPGLGLMPAAVGATTAALLEIAPLPLDDNLTVTLGGALALALAST